MDISDYHIATKKIHELREQLRATEDLCQSLVKRIQEGMHWLPMSPDAVFEDGEMYLMKTVNRTELGYFLYTVCARDESCGSFRLQANLKHPIIFTHYARITEPK